MHEKQWFLSLIFDTLELVQQEAARKETALPDLHKLSAWLLWPQKMSFYGDVLL